MKKNLRAGALIALAIIIEASAFTALAQRGQDRIGPAGNRRIRRILNDPQVGQGGVRPNRRNQVPTGPGRREQIQRQLMQAIGLSPDQRQRMAEIRQNNQDGILDAGRRFRQARQALDRAIRDENYNEKVIDQHIEEFASAQAELVKQQARVRAQLRRVLTPDQMIRLNRLERQYRQRLREERERQQGDGPQGALTPFDLPADQAEETDLISFLVFGN
jgi:Spy/CpxP family protein refolding chaperone